MTSIEKKRAELLCRIEVLLSTLTEEELDWILSPNLSCPSWEVPGQLKTSDLFDFSLKRKGNLLDHYFQARDKKE